MIQESIALKGNDGMKLLKDLTEVVKNAQKIVPCISNKGMFVYVTLPMNIREQSVFFTDDN